MRPWSEPAGKRGRVGFTMVANTAPSTVEDSVNPSPLERDGDIPEDKTLVTIMPQRIGRMMTMALTNAFYNNASTHR